MSTNDLFQYTNTIVSVIFISAAIFSVYSLYTSVPFKLNINNIPSTKDVQGVFKESELYTEKSFLKLYSVNEQQLIYQDIIDELSCISQITELIDKQLGDWNRFEAIKSLFHNKYNLVEIWEIDKFVKDNLIPNWPYNNPDDCLSSMGQMWILYNPEESPLTIIKNIMTYDVWLLSEQAVQLIIH